ncbi:unnamed protein product [Spirodela intermedia]|uniref:Uncharacterized protein n=1 Tax=Spirodela intermedia TaxID=51605 RepID=A0A7I8KTH2_SPIIN|nr:unnamed protein product [Spirodela intermedia]
MTSVSSNHLRRLSPGEAKKWRLCGSLASLPRVCTTTPCPTVGWPPVMWQGSGAHMPLLILVTQAPTRGSSPTALLTCL